MELKPEDAPRITMDEFQRLYDECFATPLTPAEIAEFEEQFTRAFMEHNRRFAGDSPTE